MISFQLILCLQFLAYLIGSQATDWCSLSCGRTKNTMCAYKPKKSTKVCKSIEPVMTPKKRGVLLHFHNRFRNRLAGGGFKGWPTAKNMRQMTWDKDLEKVAMRWALQCRVRPLSHDKCRKTKRFSYVGQNIAYQGSSNSYPGARGNFFMWVNERFKTSANRTRKFRGGAGHFTQVIWARSHKLGCAEIKAKAGMKNSLLVCNYGPGGNFIGSSVYGQGSRCSKCPKGTECKKGSAYPNLCTY